MLLLTKWYRYFSDSVYKNMCFYNTGPFKKEDSMLIYKRCLKVEQTPAISTYQEQQKVPDGSERACASEVKFQCLYQN